MIQGVFAASITPLKTDYSPDLNALPGYLGFLASRGCHGALILGTTGEGPSFSPNQRIAIYRAALEVRQDWPDFLLLAGTGTPSLEETQELTRKAYDMGFDGVVVLPPYYFRKSSEGGLFSWYAGLMDQAVPQGRSLFAYHIPGISGVQMSIDLIARLLDTFPDKFAGLKDSSGDNRFAQNLGNRFGDDLCVFTGNDRLFSLALANRASGCITAIANLISPDLRLVWDTFQASQSTVVIQEKINSVREITEQFPPFPPLIKFLMTDFFNFPRWPVCPPLLPITQETEEQVSSMLDLA
jgi:4-hydroxy-tetrahydrodipicolinate synthase